jgi:LPS export ABC transporter protein LptC
MMQRISLIAILVLVAALSLFSRRDRPDELPTMAQEPPPSQPGYFMVGANIVQTGPDGLPLYRMRAERIQQDPQRLTVELQDLDLDYKVTRDDTEPTHWTLTAKTGVMPQDATRIELRDEVEIKGQPRLGASAPSKPVTPAIIRTSNLLVDLKSHTARTRERVDILWGERRLSAVGLTADLKAERVKLESAIHGRLVR